MDAALPSVNLSEASDPRLWSLLADLSRQQGIVPAGNAAYVSPASPDLLLIPLTQSPETQLALLYHQVTGQYLFLLIDKSQVAGPQVHLWGAQQEELVISPAGLRFLPAKSDVTFRLAGDSSLDPSGIPDSDKNTASLLDKLKCYLRSLGIDTTTLTSIESLLSRAGICSEFNVISIAVTAVACVTGGVVACGVGVDTIAACVKCEPPPATTYSIGGNAGAPGVTLTAGDASTSSGNAGHYSLTGLTAGRYTITPTKLGCQFSPASRTVTLPPDATAQNFTATCPGSTNPVSWTVEDGCGNGLLVRFFDSLGHTFPGTTSYYEVPAKQTATFTFTLPQGASVCLGATDDFFGINWCAGIIGNAPLPYPLSCCTAVPPGGISKSIKLTCS
jgi:hypothetical protein